MQTLDKCPECGQSAMDADGAFYCDCGNAWLPDYSTDKLPHETPRNIIWFIVALLMAVWLLSSYTVAARDGCPVIDGINISDKWMSTKDISHPDHDFNTAMFRAYIKGNWSVSADGIKAKPLADTGYVVVHAGFHKGDDGFYHATCGTWLVKE